MKRQLWVAGLLVAGCAARQQAATRARAAAATPRFVISIPLVIRHTGPDAELADVVVDVDGRARRFLLDTGEPESSIVDDASTATYPSLGPAATTGVSGKATPCQLVAPQTIELGTRVFHHRRIKRCRQNLLGMDILGAAVFQIDLRREKLNLLNRLPRNVPTHPIRRLATGHMTIPVRLATQRVYGLFDSGADTTVIDSRYVKQHPASFARVRAENGVDASGSTVASSIYVCKTLAVGPIHLENVKMAAFDFGPGLRQRAEGAPIILGNNVIARAVWTFDLASGRWTVVPY